MSLKYDKIHSTDLMTKSEQEGAFLYSKEYMKFLKECKTEWECAEYFENLLKENGFVNIEEVTNLKKGDKVYFLNKEKSLYAAVIGEEELKNGVLMVGAHIDSPRLDLKPMPLKEEFSIALLKTQYYGGIKKYQWLSIPLAMHGIIYNKKGEKIKIVAGEDDDFCFCIADLLPHLAREQMQMKASEFIDAEKMNVMCGSMPDNEVKSDKVKYAILKILNEKYGIDELDFARAEIEIVPAFDPKYIGFDKSLIGAYGQDDRICAYATIRALLSSTDKQKTKIALIVDKEEIGSVGTTSMQSQTFDMFIKDIIKYLGQDTCLERVYYNSKMLSADVASAADNSSAEVVDAQNSNVAGFGIALEKYSGSGGKYDASDASARYMSEVMNVFESEKVAYQIGTLCKVDKGGGGTIAYILANKGVDVVDCGTAIISMHSPFEIASVNDTYMTYKAYKAFYDKMR